jgi:spore coat protein U-like protein
MTRTGAAAVALLAAVTALSEGAGAREQFPRGLMATPSSADKGCTIETRPVSFGNYDTTQHNSLHAQGQVIYTCGTHVDGRTPVKNIRIEISMGGAGSYDRRMSSGTERLFYNLYLDADHRTVWGDGSGGTDYYFDPSPPNKKPVTVTVYGRINAQQDVSLGQYSDMLQVKILF